MSHRIFTLTDTAKDKHMTLDDAVNSGEIDNTNLLYA